MTFAVSAAAHIFMVHSSLFTASATTSRDVAAVKDAFADDDGIEPVASSGVYRAAPAVPRVTESVPADVVEPAPDLSSLTLELTRRAAGPSLDVAFPLTVPPPLSH